MTILKVSDGEIFQNGDVVMVDQPIDLDRTGTYRFTDCEIDGAYFDYIDIYIDYAARVAPNSPSSRFEVVKVKPYQVGISEEFVPKPKQEDNDYLEPYEDMFRHMIKKYGLRTEAELDTVVDDHEDHQGEQP